jgi:uncharacterized protein YbjT (DUF2867 family)
MKKILVLGAGGQIAQWVVRALGQLKDITQTLLIRDPRKLTSDEPGNARVVVGSALDKKLLQQLMHDQDIVYANLSGEDLDRQAKAIIAAMKAAGVRRLIFVLALGIHDEVPGKFGEWNEATIGAELKPYRSAAALIEASGLAYTLVRPAWLTDEDEVNYELTARNESFKGTVVSRKSVADFVVKLIEAPEKYEGGSVGVNKPGTDADKPYFM